MKTKFSIWLSTVLLLAFATNGFAKYCLYSRNYYGFVAQEYELRQAPACPVVQGFSLAGEADETPTKLYDLLNTKWSGGVLKLGSPIDLKEMGPNQTACKENHKPWPQKGGFNGNGFTISNLCYISSAKMTAPVGLFGVYGDNEIKNVALQNVKISIKGSGVGEDYYPVGSVVGYLKFATMDSVSVKDVSISAPFAGGVVGLDSNSTIMHVTADDDIVVSNSVSIASGSVGSKMKVGTLDISVAPQGYNAFVGGLVGYNIRTNASPSFHEINILASVVDSATGHKSALGGLVGMESASMDSIYSVSVYTKYRDNETIPTKISGGSSMGGLIGAVAPYFNNGNYKEGKVILNKVSFDGEIGNASSITETVNGVEFKTVAVGGLVGYDYVWQSSSLGIRNSSANVALVDSVKVPGSYRYMAGGILGASNNCQSTENSSAYVSIVGSKSSGYIDLAGSAQAVRDLRMQSYVGGVAGFACLAYDGNGLKKDTSSVDISVRTKTAYKMDGNAFFDTVAVGGLAGHVNAATAEPLPLSNLRYTGSIEIKDSLNSVFVGGAVGDFSELTGGSGTAVDFKSVSVENANVVKYSATAANQVSRGFIKQVARIGGLCGYCREMYSAQTSSVVGNIDVDASRYAGDTLQVGGLMGNVTVNRIKTTTLKNTFSIGDIDVKSNDGVIANVGYLVGHLQKDKDDCYVETSYHYSDKDSYGPFGYFMTKGIREKLEAETAPSDDLWMLEDGVKYVVRNGASKNLTDGSFNGTMVEADMKNIIFAKTLNIDQAPLVWTYKSPLNENLPFFADSRYPAVAEGMIYSVSFVDFDGTLLTTISVPDGFDADAPEVPEHEGYKFKAWDPADLSKVSSSMVVYATYDTLTYKVRFVNESGKDIVYYPNAKYGSSVAAPSMEKYEQDLTKEGYTFIGWSDSSFNLVTKDLTIEPVFKAGVYRLTFKNYDGSLLGESILEYGAEITYNFDVTRAATMAYTYEFKGWSPEDIKTMPAEDLVLTAVYDSTDVLYTVAFVDYDGNQIGESQQVKYGAAAVAPEGPASEGRVFTGWNNDFYQDVRNDLVVKALYDTAKFTVTFLDHKGEVFYVGEFKYNADMSIAAALERAATDEYTYTFVAWEPALGLLTSDMVVHPVYDSTLKVLPEEPSDPDTVLPVEDLMIVNPNVELSGNAVRFTFGTKGIKADVKTSARVILSGENGILLDTLVADSLTDENGSGNWELAPSPVGKFTIKLIVENELVADSCEKEFEIASEIVVSPRSWQMVSLAALNMSEAYGEDAAFFWWDEQNPIGEYWQYRSYDAREEYEATRGFWYGTMKGDPLILRDETPSMDSEITWELDSLYSGWNLVANPHGWRLNLTEGKGGDVKFWRWNADSSYYEVAEVLEPYEAVWAQVSKPTAWTISSKPVFTVKKKESLAKASANGDWSLQVSLSDGFGKSDRWNVLGADQQADAWEEPPEGMGDHVNLSIVDGGKRLAKSVKASADEYSWDMEVNASSARDGFLTFSGVDGLAKKGLHLYVTVDGRTTEVTGSEKVKVALTKSSKQVNVRVAEGAAVKVVKSAISGLRTRQAAGFMNVNFSVSSDLNGAKARVDLIGVDAKVVSSKVMTAGAGNNAVTLDAPKSGLYYVRVQVASQVAAGKVIVK